MVLENNKLHHQLRLAADLIPNLVDKRALLTPDHTFAEYPVSAHTYDQGFRKISYTHLANAVNGVAWWLHRTLGPSQVFETLAYIGPNDIRYPALILGAVKAGYAIFVTSPRNSITAHLKLFDRLGCNILLSPSSQPPAVSAIRKESKVRVFEVPEVDYLLDIPHPRYPYLKTLASAFEEPLFIVHTSGSTGIPKPITYTHATAAANINMISLDPPSGCESQDRMYQGNRLFITFPAFHGAYLVSFLFNAIPYGTTMIVPVSGAIPSGEGLVAGLEKTEADVAIIVPSIMQDLGQSPDTLEYCAQHLNAILYCGGDLPQSIGDVVASKIKLFNQFGATELGLTPVLLSSQERDPGDWQYVQFHPDLGLEMRHVADDTFELYAVRDSRLESTQPTFTIFRDAQEYASRDLFVRHPSPSKKSLWKWKARADDIIVFLNGEKTNPISMEQHIVSSNPDVAATLVIGAQRFQAALLVELIIDKTELTSAERAVFLERLWPTVCEANRDAPSHARITKSHILFTSPQKPMMRAGKGTVQRAGTLEAYQDEIDALYKDADQMSEDTASPVPMLHDAADQVSLSQYIKETIISITGWPDLLDSENIFGLGMDSLHAIILVRNLNRALTLPDLAPSTLYTNPSVTALSHAIVALQNQRHEAEHTVHQNHLSMRSALLQEYKNKIDRLPLPSNAADGAYPSIVVLTGSTGALGTYILNSLLMSPMVSHIFCLNRAVNSLDLQISRNRYRQLPGDFPTDRVTFCTCDFSKPDLGLTADIYNTLTASNIIVIHNAWPVNFNMSIQSFRPQFDSVVNLIALTSRSKQPSRLFFISSISSVMSVGFTNSSIPERIVHTDLAVHPNGYAESKYLSELLLQYACEKLSLDCSVARVGQLTGAANNFGGWNPSEWFPSLLLSSAHIGFLPDSLGASFDKMEWIPIDYVADVVVELAIHEQQNGYPGGVKAACPSSRQAQVYQLVNPRTVHWRSMQTRVADTISRLTSTAVEIVDPKTWIVKVRDHLEITVADRGVEGALQSNPAAKLLDFYQQIMRPVDGAAVKWELEETLRHSKHFNDIPGLQEAWMDKWVEELLRPSHMA